MEESKVVLGHVHQSKEIRRHRGLSDSVRVFVVHHRNRSNDILYVDTGIGYGDWKGRAKVCGDDTQGIRSQIFQKHNRNRILKVRKNSSRLGTYLT